MEGQLENLYKEQNKAYWKYAATCFRDCVKPGAFEGDGEEGALNAVEKPCLVGCTKKLAFVEN